MNREQVATKLRLHSIAQIARESGVSVDSVYKYLYGAAVSPHIEARLESYARKVKSPSPFGDEAMNREQVVEELLRHPIKRVIRESGLPSGAVNRYLCGKAVPPYMEVLFESYARKAKRPSPPIVGDEVMTREQITDEIMNREQVATKLRLHSIAQIARESGVSNGAVNRYLDGEAVRPYIKARLESYARKVKSPSPFGDEAMSREQVVAELRRHPIAQVARESGVSRNAVHKYLDGKTVRPYIEARLEDYARKVAK